MVELNCYCVYQDQINNQTVVDYIGLKDIKASQIEGNQIRE